MTHPLSKDCLVQDVWLKPGLIPGAMRLALPYEFARSALFAAQPANVKSRKQFTKETEVASVGGFKIFQRTGTQLTQYEETLWLELLRLAVRQQYRDEDIRIRVAFTANGMLKILGKAPCSAARASLRASLNRLGDARIRVVRDDGTDWTANLLDIGTKPTDSDVSIVVYIDRVMANCLAAGYTLENIEERYALKANPLAQWLHGYYATHRTPRPINSSALKRLSGCEGTREKLWQEKLGSALKLLETVTRWKCDFNRANDIVKVDRGSKSRNLVANRRPTASLQNFDDDI